MGKCATVAHVYSVSWWAHAIDHDTAASLKGYLLNKVSEPISVLGRPVRHELRRVWRMSATVLVVLLVDAGTLFASMSWCGDPGDRGCTTGLSFV